MKVHTKYLEQSWKILRMYYRKYQENIKRYQESIGKVQRRNQEFMKKVFQSVSNEHIL